MRIRDGGPVTRSSDRNVVGAVPVHAGRPDIRPGKGTKPWFLVNEQRGVSWSAPAGEADLSSPPATMPCEVHHVTHEMITERVEPR